MSHNSYNDSSLPPTIEVNGVFWVTHWCPLYVTSNTDCRLFQAQVLWNDVHPATTIIAVAVPRDASTCIVEGAAYQIWGPLKLDPATGISLLNTNAQSIKRVQDHHLTAGAIVSTIVVTATGQIQRIEKGDIELDGDAPHRSRIIELIHVSSHPHMLYYVREDVSQLHPDQTITIEGTMTDYNEVEGIWIVEVHHVVINRNEP